MPNTLLPAKLTAAVFIRSLHSDAGFHIVRLLAPVANLLTKTDSVYCMSPVSCFHLSMNTRALKEIAIHTRQSMEQRFGKCLCTVYAEIRSCNRFYLDFLMRLPDCFLLGYC